MAKSGAPRRFPTWGLILLLAIVLLVVAFGLFKRRGARKPPPIPATSLAPAPTPAGRTA